ncbi:NAD(P)H-binding protein [Pelagibius marinus]|uniref:NAD(P)H-binding protein n=1 Tax=Pelagibius marinus TaxID=2762760 RepID=UPI001872C075|nr:NAD(P)H-binding protein [Pelagibius marinus]
MRVLLTGANGFIGAHLTAALIAAGHEVVAAVRNPAALAARFPDIDTVAADLNRDITPADWRPRLAGVDAVINCAGVLQGGRGQDMTAIHHLAPAALFDACVAAGVKRVLQISAISADDEAGTEYARTKKQGDDHLRALDLDWVVLRPSLIYGEGAYGGTAMLRALAVFPFVTPLVGRGGQAFRPLHVEDLARTVLECLTRDDLARRTLEPVGPKVETVKGIVARYRAWLGRPPARPLHIPLALIRLLCRLGDLLGRGPLTTTSLKQIEYGNVGQETGFIETIGFRPATLAESLQRRPAQTQDLWHARFYLLRPLVRAVLVLLWLISGLLGLWMLRSFAVPLLNAAGFPPVLATATALGTALLDLAIAGLLAANWRPRLTAAVQLTVIAGYTLALTVFAPHLWGDPFGPLLKNLPILVLVLVQMVLAEER